MTNDYCCVCCSPHSPWLLVCMSNLLGTPALLPLSSFSPDPQRLPAESSFFFLKIKHQLLWIAQYIVYPVWLNCVFSCVYIYLNFSEDKPVPDCIPPDNAPIEVWYFPAESQMQQPLLQWRVSLNKYLQRFETSLYSGRQQQLQW